MKKPFISAFVLGSSLPLTAAAGPVHYYDPGYYATEMPSRPQAYQRVYQPAYRQVSPTQSMSYPEGQARAAQAQKKKQQTPQKRRHAGPFSAGADYVLGYGTYQSTSFTVPSSLFGGQDYVADTKSFDKQLNSLSFNLGFRPFKHIGIEAFYTSSLAQNKIAYTESYSHFPEFARGEYEVSYKAFGLDVIGYFPINDYIEFLAAIGVGKYDAKAKIKVVAYEDTSHTTLRSEGKTFDDSSWVYRIGGGFQFWLSDRLTLRIMGRWVPINGEFIKSLTEINFGVRYHF